MAQIYIITNTLNKKQYVGVTNNSLSERFKSHCYDKKVVSDAIRKYGKDNFIIETLIECSSIDEAYELESTYILKYNTKFPNGYNISNGGRGSQVGKRKPTPEHVKEKIRESIKKNHYWQTLDEEEKERLRNIWRDSNKKMTGSKRGSYNNDLFKKTIWINNGTNNKRVKEPDLEQWLNDGWIKGHMKAGKAKKGT